MISSVLFPHSALAAPHSTTASCRRSHPSGSAVADRHLASLDDHRYIALALGVLQHLIELSGVMLHIDVVRLVAVGLTGLVGVRSARFPVDRYLVRHVQAPFSRWSFPDRSDKIVS